HHPDRDGQPCDSDPTPNHREHATEPHGQVLVRSWSLVIVGAESRRDHPRHQAAADQQTERPDDEPGEHVRFAWPEGLDERAEFVQRVKEWNGRWRVVVRVNSIIVALRGHCAVPPCSHADSGSPTATPVAALRATASVNSMYATPEAKSVNRTGLPSRIASMNSASTRQPPTSCGRIITSPRTNSGAVTPVMRSASRS